MGDASSWGNVLPSFYTVTKGLFGTALGLSTISLGLLYYGQGYLIYPSAFPPGSRTEVQNPGHHGLPFEDVTLDTPDKTKIRAFVLLQRKHLAHSHGAAEVPVPEGITDAEFAATRPTVVMFHGNGGNMGHRIPLAKIFYLRMRCNVFMLSYRGYGLSEGSPSEKGIRMDAQASLDYITNHPSLSNTKVILYGQSIGGAVAIDLASRNPQTISAIILENTFLSLPRLIPSAVPLLSPVSFLCHQKWNTASKIPLIPPQTPILMLSGARDEIVPAEHMKELEFMLRHPGGNGDVGQGRRPGRMIEFPNGEHNNTCVQPGYWTAVADFIANVL